MKVESSIISFMYNTNKLILSESALENIYLFQLDQISFQRNKINKNTDDQIKLPFLFHNLEIENFLPILISIIYHLKNLMIIYVIDNSIII
ncbi:hypothetical protein BpHYR1_017331 [Brachionus plicatilis]|uniref:Uncharacterized protein n=1 Tax=Brachionus plicatilis TaxID=10195 RepID=A0A3M7Q0Y1_BRAPC|nr:hypothetical protein BpHYR1_017331 [Brachionus plicatilis]